MSFTDKVELAIPIDNFKRDYYFLSNFHPSYVMYEGDIYPTAEHAFHMILLQFFAKNEEWMIENGLLVNGELKIYTGKHIVLLKKLLSTIEESLI